MLRRLLIRILRALFGLIERPSATLRLACAGPDWFTGDVGGVTRRTCRACVYREDNGEPVAGALVRYDILRGPAQFEGSEAQATMRSGPDGTVTVDVLFTAAGAVVVTARLVAAPDHLLVYAGRTDGTTHDLVLSSPATFPADGGSMTLRITARDHRGALVRGARLALWGAQGLDRALDGRVREIGDGIYDGVVETSIAGAWMLGVEDQGTGVVAYQPVHVLAAEAHQLSIVGDPDPRRNRPRSQSILRVTLRDRFDNVLDPGRITASVAGRPLPRTIVDPEARFPVSFPGYGRATVQLRDSESAVARDEVIEFAAAAFDAPGLIMVGSRFRMPLYGFLPPDRPGQRATIEIAFDAERTSFVGIARDQDGPALATTATLVAPNRVSISIESERSVAAEEFPDGLYVCTTEWACQAEGESCFDVTARMSPSSTPWTLCVDQKRPLTKNLCVNVIYPPVKDKADFKRAGEMAAEQITTLLASAANVERCCPILTYTLHTCEISAADWDKVIRTLGRDEIYSYPRFEALAALDLACKRSGCINLIVISFHDLNPTGQTLGREKDGTIAVDPAPIIHGGGPNIGAHEIGHALGLSDLYKKGPGGGVTDDGPKGNLMSLPNGTDLTKEQCRTIWENLDKYVE